MPIINQNVSNIPFYLTKKVSEGVAKEPGSVNLSRGQAGFLPCNKIYEEAKRIITREDETIFRYEKATGANHLRKSIATWYGKQFNLDVNPNSVAVAVGGTGAISLCLLNFTNPGDQIIIPDPSYPFYMLSAKYGLENREITRVALGSEKLTREKLEPLIKENTQLVVLTSPHNPTGVVYDEETLKGILALAEEKDFYVFYDENHYPEVYDGRKHLPIHLFDEHLKHSIMLGSLARIGIQGERIGWAVLPDVTGNLAAAFVAQSPFMCTRSQMLASFVLDHYDEMELDKEFQEYEEKRNWFVPEINKIKGFQCDMPEGTSYAFPNIKGFVEENKAKLISIVEKESRKRDVPEEDIQLTLQYNSMLVYKFFLYCIGVGSVPGVSYGPSSDDNIRFTFSAPREDLENAVDKFKNIGEWL